MKSVIKFPAQHPRPSRIELLRQAARLAALETGVTVPRTSFDQWLCNRPELLSCDEVTALQTAEYVGSWLGWRFGGKPPYNYWPSDACRPDMPIKVIQPKEE